MGFHKISADCKLATIRLHDNGILSLETILGCCRFSERTWFWILKLWQETGRVDCPGGTRHGCLHILDTDNIQYLLRLVRSNPDYFLDEFLNLLQKKKIILMHYTTIFCALEHASMSHKKLKQIVIERNEDRHAYFIERMAQYFPEELGLVLPRL